MFAKIITVILIVIFGVSAWWLYQSIIIHSPPPETKIAASPSEISDRATPGVDNIEDETAVVIQLPSPAGATLHQKIYRNGELEWIERSADGAIKRWRLDRNGNRYVEDNTTSVNNDGVQQ